MRPSHVAQAVDSFTPPPRRLAGPVQRQDTGQAQDQATTPPSGRGHLPFHLNFYLEAGGPSLWSELGLLPLAPPVVPRRCPCSQRCLLPSLPPFQQLPRELEMCLAPPTE